MFTSLSFYYKDTGSLDKDEAMRNIDRLKLKLLRIRYSIDVVDYRKDILTLKGWMLSLIGPVEDISFIIHGEDGKEYSVHGRSKIERPDVFKATQLEQAKLSGFFAQVIIENMTSFDAYLVFSLHKHKYKILLGHIDCETDHEHEPHVQEIDLNEEDGIDIIHELKETKPFVFPEEYRNTCVDIIVPVYNGYRFLDKLFRSIEQTDLPYRLIIIDDKSPDENVLPLLEKYSENKDNVILLKNEVNLGFVRSVNRGLKDSTNHVAIVNTDVELPKYWLERLMLPIFQNEKVASSTPFTNCGTLVSFPDFFKDNKLFLDLNVDQIDEVFSNIKPDYEQMPTGVGFCMGMSQKALQTIGYLDEENFGKGYGEENDWCQRGIEQGFTNVQVENLFVFHNHGGSFLSEDKKRYLEEHGKILREKHPNYDADIMKYYALDPNKMIREFAKLQLLKKYSGNHTIFAFTHKLGGGANDYLFKEKDKAIKENKQFIIVRHDSVKFTFLISYYSKDYEIKMHVNNIDALKTVLEYFKPNEIWINELVTYPNFYDFLAMLETYKTENTVKLTMFLHDFFCVCPSINLLNDEGKYCYLPETKVCDGCLINQPELQGQHFGTITRWHEEWKKLLDHCDEIIAFSNDSKTIVEKVYGSFNSLIVRPHQIQFIPTIEKKNKTTDTFNIGILGAMSKHKGQAIVKQLVQLIESRKLNMRVILIGSTPEPFENSCFKETGEYTRDEIATLTLENDIDVFLIPSIWPETFSFTTDEIMKMGYPIMCFNIGAPSERVKKYDKGIIIPEISAESMLDTLDTSKWMKPVVKNKVLFIVEEVTFSSRYRVDHLREQLLLKGIASDCYSLKELNSIDYQEYTNVVVYRLSKTDKMHEIIEKAHACDLSVYYDMDDYIFDYEAIKDLKFLDGDDYIDFDKYCKNIHDSMDLCDGYIVSTENLKKAVSESFKNKPVYVNRNVASLEMLTLSECTIKQKETGKVLIGYFSGSKTHNEDFEEIKDVLLDVMKEHENVNLLIGGQIELPPVFNLYKNRIERFDFMSWKKLPQMIARCDINLMPLQDTFFHACKSENKWMEAGLVKVATIASYNSELSLAIKDGENGYLCKDMKEWKEKLEKLVNDKTLRNTLAENAYLRVKERYTAYYLEEEILDLLNRE